LLTRRDKLRKLYKKALRQMKAPGLSAPVFIFGEMRSGTNMLTECMDRSLRTEVFNETDDVAFDGYALRNDAHIGRLIAKTRADCVVFKSLADSARARELLKTFQGSKGIWIYRRFEDVVNSALKKWTEHSQYLRYVLEEPEKARWRRMNLSDDTLKLIRAHYERGLSDASARALIWYVRNSLYFEQNLDEHEAMRLINYEKLVSAPEAHLRKVFGFVGLGFELNFVGHVSTNSVKKDVAPEIDDAVLELCNSMWQRLNDALGKPLTGIT